MRNSEFTSNQKSFADYHLIIYLTFINQYIFMYK